MDNYLNIKYISEHMIRTFTSGVNYQKKKKKFRDSDINYEYQDFFLAIGSV